MLSNNGSRTNQIIGLGAIVIFCIACGPSEEDFIARGERIEQLEGQLTEATNNLRQAQERIEELNAERTAMAERLQALGEDISQYEARQGQLSSELEAERARRAELERREQQHRERLQAMRTMIGRFRAMIESGRLRVRIVRGRMVIEMSSNILFRSGSADLNDEGRDALAEVAAVLREIPNRNFQVAGHTDNVPISGRFRSNWQLSTARALEVVEFLEEQNVDPVHLSVAGYSQHAPVSSNDTEDGRAQNRRIEIVLMPNLDELPDLSGLESELSSGSN